MVCWPILAGIPATIESKNMIEILNIIYSSNFILGYATFTAVMILLMVVITIHDYIQTMKPFWEIEKKYKKLRKAGK